MITPEDFVRRWQNNKLELLSPDRAAWWGSYDFVRYDAESVNQLSIDAPSKAFLIDAGLPKRAWKCYRFETPYPVFCPITEIHPKWPDEFRRYRLLAATGFSLGDTFTVVEYLCLDEQANGQLVTVRKEKKFSITLSNSSVVQLAEYLLVLREYLEWQTEYRLHNEDDDEGSRQLQKALEVGNLLRTINPMAANNEDSWGLNLFEIENLMI